MIHHAAYQRPFDELNVVVVDDNESMLSILRTILTAFEIRAVRCFQGTEQALVGMMDHPPNLVLADWHMKPHDGAELLRTIRQRHMEPLCFAAVMIISGHASRAYVMRAYAAGANHFLVKPVSPATIYERLTSLQNDARPFVLRQDRYIVQGVEESLRRLNDRSGRHTTIRTATGGGKRPPNNGGPSAGVAEQILL